MNGVCSMHKHSRRSSRVHRRDNLHGNDSDVGSVDAASDRLSLPLTGSSGLEGSATYKSKRDISFVIIKYRLIELRSSFTYDAWREYGFFPRPGYPASWWILACRCLQWVWTRSPCRLRQGLLHRAPGPFFCRKRGGYKWWVRSKSRLERTLWKWRVVVKDTYMCFSSSTSIIFWPPVLGSAMLN